MTITWKAEEMIQNLQKQNILWITERFPPLQGGMAESSFRQASGLRQKGYSVDVLTIVSSVEAKTITIKKVEKDLGTNIYIYHKDMHGNAAQRAWREIFSINEKKPYDLIVGFGAGFAGYTAVTYAAWLKIASLVSVRGNDFDRDWFEPKKAYFVQQALERADVIASVTKEKEEKISSLFPGKKTLWAPNGIQQDLWELTDDEQADCINLRSEMESESKTIIGIFGELKYKKRIPMFLSAIREAGLNNSIALLIAGKLDNESNAILNDPQLAPVYKHFSFRKNLSLPPIYAACDFVAIPSLFEGFPNVLLEAMAAGAIPIVSNSGAMKDVIKHNETGFLFDALSRKEAAEAVKLAVNMKEEKRASMKKRVKEYVKNNFSIEKEIDNLESEIKTLIQSYCTKGR